MPRPRRIPAAAIVLLAASSMARADDLRLCHSQLFEARHAACSRLLEASNLAPAERARILANRADTQRIGTIRSRRAAAEGFRAAALLVPGTPEALVYRALASVAQRRYPAAIALLDQAIHRDPSNGQAYIARGRAHRLNRDPGAARRDFDAAIVAGARSPEVLALAHRGRGNVFLDQGERDEAMAELDKAIAIDPAFIDVLRLRGQTKNELGRFEEAIADFDQALRHEPNYAVIYNGRGYAWSRLKNRDRALADFQMAVRLQPNYIAALSNLAVLHMNRGDRSAATTYFEQVLALPAGGAVDRERQDLARERLARLKTSPAESRAVRPAPARGAKRVALIIGNGKYQHVPVLGNPLNDARAVAAVLRRLGFASLIEVVDGNRETMQRALKEFGDQALGAEWAVVFFAGHGIEINGTSYLIPIDAALKRDTHIEDEGVSLNRVVAKVDAASKLGLVILDACRDNPFARNMVRSSGATRAALTGGLAPVEPEGNVLVAYAAKHGTTALDGTGANSPFTQALLAHIEEPGLELNFLFRRVRDAVRTQTGRRQEPFVYGSLGAEPLYFKVAAQ